MSKQSIALTNEESLENMKSFELSDIERLNVEIKEKDDKIARMQERINRLQERINRMQDPIWVVVDGRIVKYNPDCHHSLV